LYNRSMNSGVSHHARKRLAERDLASIGKKCALVAANRSWTTFALLDDRDLDAGVVARQLRVAVVQIWTDEDHGTTVAFHGADGWEAELPIERGGGGKLSAADKQLLGQLVARRIVTEPRRKALAKALAARPAVRDKWLDARGIGDVLGLPNPRVLPVPCTAQQLEDLVPDARVIEPRGRRATPAPRAVAPPSPPAGEVDRAELALHIHYWTEIFQLNCWKLYHRYKKHLPAERRHEVDKLCDLVVRGAEPSDVERAVAAILGTVWSADDWRAAIRDPELARYEPLDGDQLADWQRRLSGDA
jgi:hypothetical protein